MHSFMCLWLPACLLVSLLYVSNHHNFVAACFLHILQLQMKLATFLLLVLTSVVATYGHNLLRHARKPANLPSEERHADRGQKAKKPRKKPQPNKNKKVRHPCVKQTRSDNFALLMIDIDFAL